MSRSRVPSRSPLSTPLGAHLGCIVHLTGCELVQGLLRYLVHNRFCSLLSLSRLRYATDPRGRGFSLGIVTYAKKTAPAGAVFCCQGSPFGRAGERSKTERGNLYLRFYTRLRCMCRTNLQSIQRNIYPKCGLEGSPGEHDTQHFPCGLPFGGGAQWYTGRRGNVINLRIPFQSVKKEDKILVKVLIDK